MIKKFIPHSLKMRYRHYVADAYILSYPKSGRTWLRMLIGTVIDKHFDLGLDDLQRAAIPKLTRSLEGVPTIRLSHDDEPSEVPYQKLSIDKSRFRKKKIILMIRDPRDIVVSAYYQLKFRMNREDVKDFTLSEFIRYDTGGLRSIIKYLNSWSKEMSNHSDLIILRYEDLKNDGLGTLRLVVNFLGISASNDCLNEAIDQNSFSNLKKKEKNGDLKTSYFFGGNQKEGDEKSLKVRKGKIGGYKDELSQEDVDWMNSVITTDLSDDYAFYKN